MKPLSNSCKSWVAKQLSTEALSIESMVGDASSRHYYRVTCGEQNVILMISPNAADKMPIFIQLANQLKPLGHAVPTVYAHDMAQGWALLEDFGDNLLLDQLTPQNMQAFYTKALSRLAMWQTAEVAVPAFDEAHTRLELSYFSEWYIEKCLECPLTGGQKSLLQSINQLLVDTILCQPQVFVHRDYHSRNLLICANGELGIIDFQDALKGPLTYDLVSLLKDCYITWPESAVTALVHQYWERLQIDNKRPNMAFETFLEWFDLTGLQRHLKVLGIFSRLNIRDNKPRYLKDIPRVLQYVKQVSAKYPALYDFHDFCLEVLIPRFQAYCDKNAIENTIRVA